MKKEDVKAKTVKEINNFPFNSFEEFKKSNIEGVSQIGVVSRSRERASELAAELGGLPISISDLAKELTTCDLIVACADAPHYLLDVSTVEAAMRQHPEFPLVIIDIAVPRNVTPAVAEINNVFLYNIDDLTNILNPLKTAR